MIRFSPGLGLSVYVKWGLGSVHTVLKGVRPLSRIKCLKSVSVRLFMPHKAVISRQTEVHDWTCMHSHAVHNMRRPRHLTPALKHTSWNRKKA